MHGTPNQVMNGIVYPCALKFTRFPIQDKTKTLSSNMYATLRWHFKYTIIFSTIPETALITNNLQPAGYSLLDQNRGFTFGKSETLNSLKMSSLGFCPFLPVSLLYFYPVTETLGALCCSILLYQRLGFLQRHLIKVLAD